jgi:hypothetical protein
MLTLVHWHVNTVATQKHTWMPADTTAGGASSVAARIPSALVMVLMMRGALSAVTVPSIIIMLDTRVTAAPSSATIAVDHTMAHA